MSICKIVNLYELKLDLFSKSLNESNNKVFNNYVNLISKTDILLYENYIFDNLLDLSDNVEINDNFIKENLSFLDKFNKEDIFKVNEQLAKQTSFVTNNCTRKSAESLTKLIEMYVNGITPANLVEFTNKKKQFINEIKLEKEQKIAEDVESEEKSNQEDIDDTGLSADFVNEYVVKFFNDKYKDKLDEKQSKLLNVLFKEGNDSEKINHFNEYKQHVLEKVSLMEDVSFDIKQKVTERINEITYNPATLIDSFMMLNDLIS